MARLAPPGERWPSGALGVLARGGRLEWSSVRVEGALGIRGTGWPINCACDLGQVTSLTRSFICSFVIPRRAPSRWAPGVRNKTWPLPSGSPQASGEDDTRTDVLHSMWVTCKRCCSGEGPRVPHSGIRAGFLEEVVPELSLRGLSQADGGEGEWGGAV